MANENELIYLCQFTNIVCYDNRSTYAFQHYSRLMGESDLQCNGQLWKSKCIFSVHDARYHQKLSLCTFVKYRYSFISTKSFFYEVWSCWRSAINNIEQCFCLLCCVDCRLPECLFNAINWAGLWNWYIWPRITR